MKYLLILSIVLFSGLLTAQNPLKYTIEGQIFNLKQDSISLAQYFGTHYQVYQTVPLSKDGNFKMSGIVANPDYYVLKVGAEHINLILRDEADIKVYGDGNNLGEFCNIIGSDESQNMNSFSRELDAWSKKREQGILEMRQSPEKQEEINNELTREYYNFKGKLQSFINQNPNSPALLPALSAIDVESDFATYESVVKQLASSFSMSPSIQGVMVNYEKIKAQKEAMNFLAPGKPAPDFEDLMLDRKTTMKLSDLKGKVVLLDFWASWCGPCRRENPNVVALYEKYKDQGFTVMSVSLDNNLDSWKKAIEADNLTWPNHVSDLKKWSSAAAKIYQVQGIPFTVLIDREGNIIDTKLRGPQLEQKLAEIFGQ